MCGIAGIASSDLAAAQISEKTLAMRAFLTHRGPDDSGLYAADGIGLAHTRLSIIDLAGGHQPLANENQSIHLVANGEIYNYKELRRKLTDYGHRFRTESDCETIVHLYEQYGKGCVDYLNGMFAFALWDEKEKLLLLARDRFGIKPLYLAHINNTVCFASELTALARSGLVPKEIDSKALYAYLAFSYVPSPMSILKQVEKLRPAERLISHDGTLRREIYWKPSKVAVPSDRSEARLELARRLEDSVGSHLVADVPVGAFLSGGLDSSTVVAIARKQQNIDTFCASFPGSGIDEAPYARSVSRHLGTRHHEVAIQLDPRRLFQEAIDCMDEPFADSSALPTFAVCRAARQVTKVVLSGDGGDEVFGGYTGRYRVAAMAAMLPRPGGLARLLRSIPPWRSGRRSSTPSMLASAALTEEERYVRERQVTHADQRRLLFGQDGFRQAEAELRALASQSFSRCIYKHPVHRALWQDISTSLADDMLTKVDRMSMANGLEVRVPLLDRRLVEFSLSLPPHWLVSPLPLEGKRILRQVASPLLPPGFLKRPKQGFVVPLNFWLMNWLLPIFDELLADTRSQIGVILDPRRIVELRHSALGDNPRQDLYALIVLEAWLQRFFCG